MFVCVCVCVCVCVQYLKYIGGLCLAVEGVPAFKFQLNHELLFG